MNVIAEINNHLEILTTQENLKSDGLEFHFFIEQLKGKIDETNVDESIKVLKPIFTDLDLYVQIIDKNIFQTSFSKWLKNFQSSENFKNPFELANHIIERLNIDNIFFINSYIYTNGIDVHGEFGVLVEHYILTNPNKSYLLELTADE